MVTYAGITPLGAFTHVLSFALNPDNCSLSLTPCLPASPCFVYLFSVWDFGTQVCIPRDFLSPGAALREPVVRTCWLAFTKTLSQEERRASLQSRLGGGGGEERGRRHGRGKGEEEGPRGLSTSRLPQWAQGLLLLTGTLGRTPGWSHSLCPIFPLLGADWEAGGLGSSPHSLLTHFSFGGFTFSSAGARELSPLAWTRADLL